MAKTMLLDRTTWDLVIDAYGNIAVADVPYSQAQDVASAQRTFAGECWYDQSLGLPYWSQILEKKFAAAILRSKLSGAALTVPGVVNARVTFSGVVDRRLTGQTQIVTTTGVTQVVTTTLTPTTGTPLRDSDGNLVYDSDGNLIYAST